MALKVGTADVADVKLGATQVAKVMLGTEQVWPVAPAQPGYRYLNTYSSPNYDTQGVCRSPGGPRHIFNPVDLDGKQARSDLETMTTITAVWADDQSPWLTDTHVTIRDPNYNNAIDCEWDGSYRGDDQREFIITHINGVPIP